MKLYMFWAVPLSTSGVFHCIHGNGICHTGCEQDQNGTVIHPDPARNLYDIYHCHVYSEKLLMMDRGTARNR